MQSAHPQVSTQSQNLRVEKPHKTLPTGKLADGKLVQVVKGENDWRCWLSPEECAGQKDGKDVASGVSVWLVFFTTKQRLH